MLWRVIPLPQFLHQETTTTSAPRDSLASLYRPPFHLMTHGSFEQAKSLSSSQDKWLLVITFSPTTEFSSQMLNREIFGQMQLFLRLSKPTSSSGRSMMIPRNEGRKVCTSIPVILVIDPTTVQKMRMWCGMVEPKTLLEDLVPFMDGVTLLLSQRNVQEDLVPFI